MGTVVISIRMYDLLLIPVPNGSHGCTLHVLTASSWNIGPPIPALPCDEFPQSCILSSLVVGDAPIKVVWSKPFRYVIFFPAISLIKSENYSGHEMPLRPWIFPLVHKITMLLRNKYIINSFYCTQSFKVTQGHMCYHTHVLRRIYHCYRCLVVISALSFLARYKHLKYDWPLLWPFSVTQC